MNRTRTGFLFFIMILFSTTNLYSQFKMDCNTIFVCIKEKDFESLFKNSFVKDTLFFCRENTTKTSDDNYSGKYFIGEFATIEFFKPSSESQNFGDRLNDIGIEFKTRGNKELDKIFEANKNSLAKEQKKLSSDGADFLWYTSLRKKQSKLNLEVPVIEYSANYLERLGFSKQQLSEEILPSTYNQIVYQGKAYPRKFKSFRSISLDVNSEGKKYLRQIAKHYKFKFYQSYVACNDFIIYYKWNKKIEKNLLKAIEINLTESLPNKEIAISENITVSITDSITKILFNN